MSGHEGQADQRVPTRAASPPASEQAERQSRRSLELACIELARYERWEDLARLCPLPFDPDTSGSAVGFHLTRALVELGDLDAAEEVLDVLQMRPDPFGSGGLDRLAARVSGERERERTAAPGAGSRNGSGREQPLAPSPGLGQAARREVPPGIDGPTDAELAELPRFELDPGAASHPAGPTRLHAGGAAPQAPAQPAQDEDPLIIRAAGASRRAGVVRAEQAVAWWVTQELAQAGHAVTCERAPRRADRYLECSWRGPYPPRLVLELWGRDEGASGRRLLWSTWRLSLGVPLGAAAQLLSRLERVLRTEP